MIDRERIETLTARLTLSAHMSETAVDPETVRHVAELARIDLDDDEVERFAEQFGAILDHFEALDDVPAVESDPDLVNVLRTDETEECLSQAEALANAPETEEGRFKGPNVS